MATMVEGGFAGFGTSGYMWSGTGTTYTLYNASGGPMTLTYQNTRPDVCSCTTCTNRRTSAPPVPTPKTPPVKPPAVRGEWGWQVGRGSQGYARPPGYTGRHGKHPGYQPKGFRRMDRLAQIRKNLAGVRT